MSEVFQSLESMAAVGHDDGASTEDRVNAARSLMVFGYFAEASEILVRLTHLPALGQRAALLLCRRLLEGERLRRDVLGAAADLPGPPPVADAAWDKGGWIGIAPRSGASRIVVVFGAHRAAFGMLNQPRFTEDRHSHLVFLRDPSDGFYLSGLRGLGDDYRQCVEALGRIFDGLLANRPEQRDQVYCVGTSIGGYAALRFSLDLRVRAVMGFSAVTSLYGGDEYAEKYPRLDNFYRLAPAMAMDLAQEYLACADPPKLVLHYGADHQTDVDMADRMRIVPGAELVAVENYAGHNTFTELVNRGELAMCLKRLYSK